MQINKLRTLSVEDLYAFSINPQSTIEYSASDLEPIQARRAKLLEKAKTSTIYGVNTGFGLLSEKKVESSKLKQLQLNLLRSHATGIGGNLNEKIVRTMLALRILNLFKEESCASKTIIDGAIKAFNEKYLPLVPEIGSVGASGDLAPLAHLATIFTGDGKGHRYQSNKIVPMKEFVSTPMALEEKDGLAFINGVQGILSISMENYVRAKNLLSLSNLIACLSLEALKGSPSPFDSRLFISRPHPGMRAIAKHIQDLLSGSAIVESHKNCGKVQDPYSFRCIPQVHGSLFTVLKHVEEVMSYDLNAASDNPLVYEGPEGLDVISGGNFHGMPLALTQDYLATSLSSLANIMERRIDKLINPTLSGLPAFLTKDPGLNSGMMIVQVSAAALCNKLKALCFPNSADTIPTSADKEDHVSMGFNSAVKTRDVITLSYQVLVMEAITAAQGIEFHRPLQSTKPVEWIYEQIRKHVNSMMTDRYLGDDIQSLNQAIEKLAEENPWKLSG